MRSFVSNNAQTSQCRCNREYTRKVPFSLKNGVMLMVRLNRNCRLTISIVAHHTAEQYRVLPAAAAGNAERIMQNQMSRSINRLA